MDVSVSKASVVPFGKTGQRPQSEATLARIADILGCPVEAFAEGGSCDSEVFGGSELLRLWLAIEDSDDRGKVLDLARTLARR